MSARRSIQLTQALRRNTLIIIASLLVLSLGVPIFSVLSSLFSADQGAWSHIAGTVLPDLILNTVLLAFFVAIGVGVIGTFTAWLTVNFEFPGRAKFEWLLILPLAMPAYVMAYAYTDLLQYSGPLQSMMRETFGWSGKADYWFPEVRSLGGAAVMLMFVLYPYVYMLARVAFLEQSSTLTEAARTFGYRRFELFWRVSLPLARPAIAAGVALALMETLADYGTVSYFGVNTFTTGIFNAWFSQGDHVSAAKLAVMLMGIVLLIVSLERLARRRARYHQQRGTRAHRKHLHGAARYGAATLCLMPLFIGFLLPTLILLKLTISDGDVMFAQRFIKLASNSLALAAVTAGVAVLIGLWLAYVARSLKSRIAATMNRVVGIGYAIPGTVIAVGVLLPVIYLDRAISGAIEICFGMTTGLLLTGSLVVLVYAYLIRFLAVALQSVEAGLSKITPSMDDAARSLGASSTEVMRRVHAPLLRTSLITAGLLVFVDVMKELPATLVLRPFNFDTLAVQAYILAKDERLAEASTAALAIVLVGLIPVIFASRAITKNTTDNSTGNTH